MNKIYSAPQTLSVQIETYNDLLMLSGSGEAQLGEGTIGYDGVGGSFDSDESVASRRGSLWSDDYE